jgi:hypothetical protein
MREVWMGRRRLLCVSEKHKKKNFETLFNLFKKNLDESLRKNGIAVEGLK